mmetsp:Transcript_53673/g.88447  ORF Transcript_53673/g.88447 Transcript_53673/m.88447 type:complete len:80 (-) Transcript_53673:495-734(-)
MVSATQRSGQSKRQQPMHSYTSMQLHYRNMGLGKYVVHVLCTVHTFSCTTDLSEPAFWMKTSAWFDFWLLHNNQYAHII